MMIWLLRLCACLILFHFFKGGDYLRIAICDDDRAEQQQLIRALHGWDPTRNPECFTDGA